MFSAACAMLVACQEPTGVASQTSKGGPNDDGAGDGSPSTPAPTTGPGSTGDDPGSTAFTGTSVAGDDTGTATATGELTGTTDAPAICGDGFVDPGESCDESFAGNNDAGACTQGCKTASCGDGLVWAGHEACDQGPDNNDVKWGGCTTTCELGPRCGDGAFQPGDEECDASAPPVEWTVGCDPDSCRFQARVAFVTSAEFTGQLGGLAGADAACAAAAAAAGLDNAPAFMAWISDGKVAPATRLVKGAQAIGYPYARRDGKRLAYDLKSLTSDGIEVPLDITEFGVTLPPLHYAWTNVHVHGEPFSQADHCQGWTSQSFKDTARTGQVSPLPGELLTWQQNGLWTSYAAQACNFKPSSHLYCFED